MSTACPCSHAPVHAHPAPQDVGGAVCHRGYPDGEVNLSTVKRYTYLYRVGINLELAMPRLWICRSDGPASLDHRAWITLRVTHTTHQPPPPQGFWLLHGEKEKGPSYSARPSHVCGHRLLSLSRLSCLPHPRVSFSGLFARLRTDGKRRGAPGT
jgi:hypothetical protein